MSHNDRNVKRRRRIAVGLGTAAGAALVAGLIPAGIAGADPTDVDIAPAFVGEDQFLVDYAALDPKVLDAPTNLDIDALNAMGAADAAFDNQTETVFVDAFDAFTGQALMDPIDFTFMPFSLIP
jgi:hypothetical protein